MSLLRRFFPRTYLARRNLSRARARTLLAVLTVAIGVVAVGGLGLFGLAFEASQQETLGDLATEVAVTEPQNQFGLAAEDAPALDERRLRTIREVAAEYDATVTAFREGNRSFAGGDELQFAAKGVENPGPTYGDLVVEGAIPSNWQTGAVITERLNQFRDEPVEVGDSIVVNGRTQRVIAIIEPPVGLTNFDAPEAVGARVLLPMRLVEPVDADRPYSGAIVHADDTQAANEISNRLETALNRGLRDDQEQFGVESVEEEAETVEKQLTSTSRFLVGVGSISLLIAGISIANVRMMSVRERREEIGVLRAVGYGRLDIVAVMLIESVLVGLVAAAVGVGLTVGAGATINSVLLDDPTAFQPGTPAYLLGAFGFGVAVCVVGGLYPAWRAARERPVEAIEG